MRSPSACRLFWDNMRPDDPKFKGMCEIMALPNWQSFTIPLIVHGDGAVFTVKHEQKLLTFSVRSLISSSEFKPRIVPMMSLVDGVRCKQKDGWSHDTLDAEWPYIVQGLNDGYRGVFSDRPLHQDAWPRGSYHASRAGKKICEGAFVFVVWIITSDVDGL